MKVYILDWSAIESDDFGATTNCINKRRLFLTEEKAEAERKRLERCALDLGTYFRGHVMEIEVHQ